MEGDAQVDIQAGVSHRAPRGETRSEGGYGERVGLWVRRTVGTVALRRPSPAARTSTTVTRGHPVGPSPTVVGPKRSGRSTDRA